MKDNNIVFYLQKKIWIVDNQMNTIRQLMKTMKPGYSMNEVQNIYIGGYASLIGPYNSLTTGFFVFVHS